MTAYSHYARNNARILAPLPEAGREPIRAETEVLQRRLLVHPFGIKLVNFSRPLRGVLETK